MTFIYNTPINLNIPHIALRSNPTTATPVGAPSKDLFSTNPMYEKFGTKADIEMSAKSNPRIKELLGEYHLPIKVNTEELESLKQGHLKDTRIIAAKIYSALPQELKNEVNLSEIQEAAMLHDYGKVLIPSSILNKAGKLTDNEREIMQLHSEIGYELLKDKGLEENTLNLIKYHHQTPDGNGYPSVVENYTHGIDSQILNVADKYAALREKRSYKEALSKEEALNIIKQDVDNGLISEEIFNALSKIA